MTNGFATTRSSRIDFGAKNIVEAHSSPPRASHSRGYAAIKSEPWTFQPWCTFQYCHSTCFAAYWFCSSWCDVHCSAKNAHLLHLCDAIPAHFENPVEVAFLPHCKTSSLGWKLIKPDISWYSSRPYSGQPYTTSWSKISSLEMPLWGPVGSGKLNISSITQTERYKSIQAQKRKSFHSVSWLWIVFNNWNDITSLTAA